MCNRMHYERHGALPRMLYMLGEYGPLHTEPLRAAVHHPDIAGVRSMQRGELLPTGSGVHRHPDVGLSTSLITMSRCPDTRLAV
jgi:hypothetical protein